MTDGGRESLRPVRAVLRAVEILEALAEAGEPLGVSEISRRVAISKTACHNMLNTMLQCGLVRREPHSRNYVLGWRLFELGSALLQDQDLHMRAVGYLDELAETTGETVLLAILDGLDVLYLASADSPRSVKMVANRGGRAPLHATSSGKVLLAWDKDELTSRVVEAGLPRLTPTTITTAERFNECLREVESQGFAKSLGEREPGVNSVAVPIRSHDGDVVGALALAGPSDRFGPDAFDNALPSLQKVAARISGDLGYTGTHHQGLV